MNLYINTSGEHCEIALLSDKTIAHKIHQAPMEHSTVLHNLINDVLSESNITLREIKSIALLNGPGSYTGLRIGLAAAKGFCYALDIPLILFNKLTLCADYYRSKNPGTEYLACIDPARQGEYFFYLESSTKEICAPLVQNTEFIIEQLSTHKNVVIISSKDEPYQEFDSEVAKMSLSIEYIGEQISKRLINNHFDDIYRAEPFYLKKVHANQPKKRF